jgi:murein L,D-transpeptidase YafK
MVAFANLQDALPEEIDSLLFKKIDTIKVEKQKHLMTVFHENKPVKSYRIALGFSPIGHKVHEGDGKTPEGVYYIVGKNAQSRFHLSLKLSYPSLSDLKYAQELGLNPGGNIMIHGLAPHLSAKDKWHAMKDWTLGCIAVTNHEIEEIFNFADVGTKVEILP